MKNKPLVLSLGAIIACTIVLYSCKKINEATELGGGLIPPVDNIHTFDTTLEVQAFNDSFTMATDSIRSLGTDEQFLGQINNDPFFGKTDARMFLQMKPGFFKYTFLNKPDSLYIDSVVLVLSYVETYGDTTVPQTVNVYEIDQASEFADTTIFTIRKEPNVVKGPLLGTKTFQPLILNDSIKAFADTTVNQLRIRLNNSFGQRLLSYDTTGNDAYVSDSLFNTKLKGFALESTSGNAVMGFNLQGAGTKLAIYYRYNDKSVTDLDTTVAYWPFSGNVRARAANYVKRDYTGTPLAASIGGTTPDDIVYLQNTPGTFAVLKVPGLTGLSNRIVHRAELIMDELYDISDSMFAPPPGIFLEVLDTAANPDVYRNIPYDLTLDGQGTLDLTSFGVYPFRSADPVNNPIYRWNFNLTRYVQNIVNGKEPVYPSFRLSSPFETLIQYRFNAQSESLIRSAAVNGVSTKGRVRLAGGNHPSVQKMRLRIVYSKI